MLGLIDGHLHISFGEARSEEELALYTPVEYRTARALWNARKVLRAGVTSPFDAATTFNIGPAVRDAIYAGMFEGRASPPPDDRLQPIKVWKMRFLRGWNSRPAKLGFS